MSVANNALGEILFNKLKEYSLTPIEFTSVRRESLRNSENVTGDASLSCKGRQENVTAFLASLTEEEKAVDIKADTGPQEGDQCPDLTVFSGVTGDPVVVAFTAEDPKVYLIDFWTTWCGPCQGPMAHNQEMLEHNPEWEGKAEILCISLDNDTR